ERGLAEMSAPARQRLADRVIIKISPGTSREARVVDVRDYGIGIKPEDMPKTILSLNESNKIRKHYLAGTYGQGGSSTFAISAYTIIASRHRDESRVAFTIVKFLDLPPEDYKTGHYVYFTIDDALSVVDSQQLQFPPGTLVRHLGYDLSSYSSPVGPSSVY